MSDSAKLTFVVTCKGRLGHLKQSLPTLAGQPNSQTVVVDSSCPDGTAAWVTTHFPLVTVVCHDDGGFFSRSISNNKGAAAANTAWLCFIDADGLLAPDFVQRIEGLLDAPRVLRLHTHGAGWIVVPADQFRSIGGFDEVFEDWGDEDDDVQFRLSKAHLPTVFLPPDLVAGMLEHSSADRVRYHAEKDIHVALFRNSLYRYIKNLLLNNSQEPTLDERRVIFERLKQAIALGLRTNAESVDVEIPIPNTFWIEGAVESTLRLRLDLTRVIASLRGS
jgi:GT2 family glycosyltransferase